MQSTFFKHKKNIQELIKTKVHVFPFEKIFIRKQQHILIPLGDTYIYQYLQDNADEMKKYKKFWVYDRSKLDLTFEMVNLNIEKITYITKTQFQTVQIVPKQQKSQFLKYSSQQKKDKIINFLGTYDFQIIKTYLDLHPINAYLMLCRYMGIQPDNQIKHFFRDSYSLQQIRINQSVLPYMTQIRKQHIKDFYMKVKNLQRIKTPQQQDKKLMIQKWKEIYGLQIIEKQKSTLVSRQIKKQWISKYQYGFPIDLSQLLQDIGKFYCYAQFR